MVKKKNKETKKHHTIFFGLLFVAFFSAISFIYVRALITNPENLIIHTRLIYFDGKFSSNFQVEDTKTAAYFLNESGETIYATAYENNYDGTQKVTNVSIYPDQNQFLKTEGPGVIVFVNQSKTSSSTIVFTNNPPFKKYFPKAFYK